MLANAIKLINDDVVNFDSIKLKKRELRKEIKAQLEQMPNDRLDDSSSKVVANVCSLPEIAAAQTVAIFLSMPYGELRSQSLVAWLFEQKKRVFVPKILDLKLGIMDFVEVFTPDELKTFSKDKFGIPDPPITVCNQTVFDVMIVPGLAFDKRGSRLGRGGGFYDRVLSKKKCACKVGVCFDLQLLSLIPTDSIFDQRVDMIVSESEKIRI